MGLKARIFFGLYLLAGLFCLAVLVVSKLPDTARKFVNNDGSGYGDLYDMCRVSLFKGQMKSGSPHLEVPGMRPVVESPPEHAINDAEVVFMCDSFIDQSFVRDFERLTGTPSYRFKKTMSYEKPYRYQRQIELAKSGKMKYLVYARSERYLVTFMSKEDMDDYMGRHLQDLVQTPVSAPDAALRRYMVDEKDLEFLITANPLVYRFIEARNTFRFVLLGEMSAMTPLYSVRPPMLYYNKAVDFNLYEKNDNLIWHMANNIKIMDAWLEENYGIKVLFIVVPDKFTVYGYDYGSFAYNYSGLLYDDFLQKLYSELDYRDVAYVDLYHEFMKQRGKGLYYTSDTHWNEKGKAIAMAKLIELYRLKEGERPSEAR